MKELRESIRYSLAAGIRKTAIVEIGEMGSLRGIISDLSTGGFSFIINMNDFAESEFIHDKIFFVRIMFDRFKISAEVEKRWSLIKNAENNREYNAGVSFRVISNEDRLRLNEIIDYLRVESSASRRKFDIQ